MKSVDCSGQRGLNIVRTINTNTYSSGPSDIELTLGIISQMDSRLTAESRVKNLSTAFCCHPDRHPTTGIATDQGHTLVNSKFTQGRPMSESRATVHAAHALLGLLCTIFSRKHGYIEQGGLGVERLWEWPQVGTHQNKGPEKDPTQPLS